MEIVQFKNGKYGIRKRNLFHKIFKKEGVFKNFRPIIIQWRRSDDDFFKDCQLESIDSVTTIFEAMKGGVIEKIIEN